MQEDPAPIEHPLTTLGQATEPNAYVFLAIGLIAGIFIGIAIMAVRSSRRN